MKGVIRDDKIVLRDYRKLLIKNQGIIKQVGLEEKMFKEFKRVLGVGREALKI